MEEKEYVYQITGFQTVFKDGTRDNAKIDGVVFTDDLESFRKELIRSHGCYNVNLTYIEIEKDKLKNLIKKELWD